MIDLQSLFNWKPLPAETEYDRLEPDGMHLKATFHAPDVVLSNDHAYAGIRLRFDNGKLTYYPDTTKAEPIEVHLDANWQVILKGRLKISRENSSHKISRIDFDLQDLDISFQDTASSDEGFKARFVNLMKSWLHTVEDAVTSAETRLLRLNLPEGNSFWQSYIPMLANQTVAEIVNSEHEDARLLATQEYFGRRGYGFKHKANTGAPYGYGEGQVSFTRWELERGVFHPMKGSAWWQAMNANILNDMEQAALIYELELINSVEAITNRKGVLAWLGYLINPNEKSWYLAHNTSVMEGYVANAHLVRQESLLEQIFVCNVLSHVLFAEAMVNDKTILPSEFANPAGTTFLHLFDNIIPELKDVYVDSVEVAVTISLFYPMNYPLHEPFQGLLIAETYEFDRASEIATLVRQNIIDPACYGDVQPQVVSAYKAKMERLIREHGNQMVWKLVINDGVLDQEVLINVAKALKELDEARLEVNKPVKGAQKLVSSILNSLHDGADDVADAVKDKFSRKKAGFMAELIHNAAKSGDL